MIGLVIVTHGRLAAELLAALEHVVGRQEFLRTVCVGAEDDISSRRIEVGECISEVDQGLGVILLTDMFGGSPSNICVAHMTRGDVEVLGGVNLPMLVKLSKIRERYPLAQAVRYALEAGRKYICAASEAVPSCRGTADHAGASSLV